MLCNRHDEVAAVFLASNQRRKPKRQIIGTTVSFAFALGELATGADRCDLKGSPRVAR
jgi:hypothetical protein